jgi:hypothetical protein
LLPPKKKKKRIKKYKSSFPGDESLQMNIMARLSAQVEDYFRNKSEDTDLPQF